MMINYGMDKMKFGQAVLSGQSIRLVTTLHSLTNPVSYTHLAKIMQKCRRILLKYTFFFFLF